jgi:carbamoyl-phosphate synthase large subunit
VLALGAEGVLADELQVLERLGFTVLTEPDGAGYDLLIDVTQTRELRRALESGVPYVSTVEAARWTVAAMRAAAAARARGSLGVTALQDLHVSARTPVSAG